MTTTYNPTKNERILVSRANTSRAALAQITAGTLTRSAAVATFNKTAHGLSTNDIVLIQQGASNLYNGVFTITVVDANNFTYTMKTDPGVGGGTIATADKALVSTVLDLSQKFSALVWGSIQNGGTGPTLAAQLWMGMASTNNEYDYFGWRQMQNGDVTAGIGAPVLLSINQPGMFIKFALVGNTGQPVEWSLYGQEFSTVVGN